jgi:hypothetical protein
MGFGSRQVLLSAGAAMLLVMAGCGGDGDAPRPTPTASAPVAPTATAVPSASETASAVPATATAPLAATATATDTIVPSATPTTTPDTSILPAYAQRGPYVVGVTTLTIGDRDIEVWYPVDPGTEAGAERASYASFTVLPEAIQRLLPPDLNIVVPMDAYRDLRISAGGPYPILTFSHGAGGFRQAYSGLLTGIASHGLVVVSLDHLEWGLLAQVGLLPPGVDRDAGEVVLAAVAQLAAAHADPSSPLFGGIDATRIATAGHSAGGRAAFALPDRAEVRAMLGFATGASSSGVAGKPILLLAGAEDAGAQRLEQAYDDLSPVKRFVAIDRAAHNSFTDQCAIIWGGNNFLIKLVEAGFPIPQNLLDLAIDGCRPENLAPAEFWKVTQHFTVAHLRAAFGLDDPPVGLGDGVGGAFGAVTLSYRHEDDVNATPAGVRGFVFAAFASIPPTFEGDPCPGGFNLNPNEQVPPLADDCDNPETVTDPLFKTVAVPGTIDGVDLDGVNSRRAAPSGAECPHDDLTGPSGEPGVDFQYWRAVGCVRGFQPAEIADTVITQAVRDGSMTILLQVRGLDDLQNDDDVRVQIFASLDSPPVGADGRVLPFGTLSADSDPRYRSTVGAGRIVDGVLSAGPFDVKVHINIQIVAGDLTFGDAHLRVALRPDGTAHGMLYGFQPADELYDIFGRKAGAAGAQALGYTCAGLYAALTSHADGDYDAESGRCTSLSVGYRFEAVPAFIAR